MAKGKKSKEKPIHQAPTPSAQPAQLYPMSGGPSAPRGSPVPGESWYSHGGVPMNSPMLAAPSALGSPMGDMTGSSAFPPLNIITSTTQTVTEDRAGDVPAATFGWGATPNTMGGGSMIGGTPNIGSDWGGKRVSSSKDRDRKVKFGETSAAPSPAAGAGWGPGSHDKWDQPSPTDSRWEDKYGNDEGPNEWGHYDHYEASYRGAPPQPPHAAHFPPSQSHSSFAAPRQAPRPPQPVAGPSKPPAWQSWGKENKPMPPPMHSAPPSVAPPSAISQNQSWQSWASEAQKLQKTASNHSSAKPPPKLSDTLGEILNHGTPSTQSRYLGSLTKAQQESLQRYAQERGFRPNPLLATGSIRQEASQQGGWGSQPHSTSWGAPASSGGWGAKGGYDDDDDEEDEEDEEWDHDEGWGNGGWGQPGPRGHNDWGSTSDNRSRKSGKGDAWSAKGDNWGAKGNVWKDGDWGADSGWGDATQNPDKGAKPKHGQYKGWSDGWDIVEEDEEDEEDISYSVQSPNLPGKPRNPSLLTPSVGFGTINGDNYPLPSKTLAHAYTLAGTPLPKSEELPTQIVESKGAALAPAQKALFDTKSRFARDRLHWMFPPHKDQRVADVMGRIQKDAYNVGVFGLRKFLQTRERGALLINASFTPASPSVLALDWLTFDQLQQTRDRILQHKTGNSVAIWRRKVVVPNNVRLMYQPELKAVIEGLRTKREYVVHIDELPIPKTPKAPEPPVISKSTKKSLKRKNTLTRDIPTGPGGKPVKKKKKSWWKRLFRI